MAQVMPGSKKVVIGRIAGVYGVKGWVKIQSFTSPMDNFLRYRQCELRADGAKEGQGITFDEGRLHGNGLVAHIRGVDDRDQAAGYVGREVTIAADTLPALPDDEFYWHQLEGLRVSIVDGEGTRHFIGVVDHLMETGSADVLVIAPAAGSIDTRERLIPFQLGQVVKSVDLSAGEMLVDWDPEF